jgi:hypothetical protein
VIRRVHPGCLIPRFYGVVYVSPWRNEAVCLPIPINLVARYTLKAWWWVRNPSADDFADLYEKVRDRLERQYRSEIHRLTLEKHHALGCLETARERIAELTDTGP